MGCSSTPAPPAVARAYRRRCGRTRCCSAPLPRLGSGRSTPRGPTGTASADGAGRGVRAGCAHIGDPPGATPSTARTTSDWEPRSAATTTTPGMSRSTGTRPSCGAASPLPCGASSLAGSVCPSASWRGVSGVSFVKVAEFQRRGVVHFYVLIRLDGVDSFTPPTLHLGADDLPSARGNGWSHGQGKFGECCGRSERRCGVDDGVRSVRGGGSARTRGRRRSGRPTGTAQAHASAAAKPSTERGQLRFGCCRAAR